jgi:hypothetical protein
MKAEITNRFDIGDLTLTLTTALFARKRNNVWKVHLNYHQLNVKYLREPQEGVINLLSGPGLTLQTSRDNDWISGISLILGSIGIIVEVIKLIKQVMEILADVSSLIPKVLEWIQLEITKLLEGQEPTYQKLNEAKFVLQLMKDGAHIERRLPRWRMKSIEQVLT